MFKNVKMNLIEGEREMENKGEADVILQKMSG